MEPHRRRTHATSLTDDELILLDCLFGCGAPAQFLRREGFEDMWNFASHSLNDDDLRKTIKRFVSCEFLEVRKHADGSFLCMTARGGREWEAERLPVWHRFAGDGGGDFEMEPGKSHVTIRATTPQTLDDFWTIGREIGYFTEPSGLIERTTVKDAFLVPWKCFSEAFFLSAVLKPRPWHVDWPEFNRRRTWWRTVNEMDKFWGEAT
jgi:hypothetical protein